MYTPWLCVLVARAQDEAIGEQVRFSQSSEILVQLGWGLSLAALFVAGYGFAQGRDPKTLQWRAGTGIGWGIAMLFVGITVTWAAPVMSGHSPTLIPGLPSWRTLVLAITLSTVAIWQVVTLKQAERHAKPRRRHDD